MPYLLKSPGRDEKMFSIKSYFGYTHTAINVPRKLLSFRVPIYVQYYEGYKNSLSKLFTLDYSQLFTRWIEINGAFADYIRTAPSISGGNVLI